MNPGEYYHEIFKQHDLSDAHSSLTYLVESPSQVRLYILLRTEHNSDYPTAHVIIVRREGGDMILSTTGRLLLHNAAPSVLRGVIHDKSFQGLIVVSSFATLSTFCTRRPT